MMTKDVWARSLLDALADLADLDRQRRDASREGGPEASVVERIERVYDDCDLPGFVTTHLGGLPAGAPLRRSLAELDAAIDRVDVDHDAATLLSSPEWSNVVEAAARTRERLVAFLGGLQ